jgi:hypothetical protein
LMEVHVARLIDQLRKLLADFVLNLHACLNLHKYVNFYNQFLLLNKYSLNHQRVVLCYAGPVFSRDCTLTMTLIIKKMQIQKQGEGVAHLLQGR